MSYFIIFNAWKTHDFSCYHLLCWIFKNIHLVTFVWCEYLRKWINANFHLTARHKAYYKSRLTFAFLQNEHTNWINLNILIGELAEKSLDTEKLLDVKYQVLNKWQKIFVAFEGIDMIGLSFKTELLVRSVNFS